MRAPPGASAELPVRSPIPRPNKTRTLTSRARCNNELTAQAPPTAPPPVPLTQADTALGERCTQAALPPFLSHTPHHIYIWAGGLGMRRVSGCPPLAQQLPPSHHITWHH